MCRLQPATNNGVRDGWSNWLADILNPLEGSTPSASLAQYKLVEPVPGIEPATFRAYEATVQFFIIIIFFHGLLYWLCLFQMRYSHIYWNKQCSIRSADRFSTSYCGHLQSVIFMPLTFVVYITWKVMWILEAYNGFKISTTNMLMCKQKIPRNTIFFCLN